MIQNNLDPEVAENPQELVVYGGIGRAARNWACYDKILELAQGLDEDETLLIQSGKPVGVFKTHADAPRVLIANSNLVPKWATWEHFHELDRKGLFMYGQMTAGSWIYIGTQGIVQGTFETFVEAGRQHYNNDLSGKWILTAGLGGMGGAQPLAATLAGAVSLNIECQQSSIDFRLRTRYVDKQARDIDHAIELIKEHTGKKEAVSIALLGNAADVLPELVKRAKAGGIKPDLVTDQTSAHDLINGYLPIGWTVAQWKDAQRDPSQHARLTAEAARSLRGACAGHAGLLGPGHSHRGLRQQHPPGGLRPGREERVRLPRLRARLHPPAVLRRQGALPLGGALGRSGGHLQDRCQDQGTVPRQQAHATAGSTWRASASASRACLRASAGWVWASATWRAWPSTRWCKNGELKAPIVIGRDHLDTGSVASPNRETEAMKDGTDAVSDWPLLNALLNTAGGATWVSLHHGGGVGMGYSQHAGMVIVADGTDAAAERLARVLVNDRATGVMRHADAGYEQAIATAKKHGLKLPMVK